jgi:hypothetical protein
MTPVAQMRFFAEVISGVPNLAWSPPKITTVKVWLG